MKPMRYKDTRPGLNTATKTAASVGRVAGIRDLLTVPRREC